MGATKPVTDATFEQEVLKAGGPVLVDFWAEWCGPCRKVAPVLEELATEMGDDVKIVKVDTDANPETTRKYQVMSVPTLLLFKGGEAVGTIIGAKPKGDIKKLITNAA
ncbi:thioredoxin [Stackebrandtia endophytica]|uniref:Thioredoxin n=1 Tax=Stackebrandtia endophytica TaxID=1496996 RepID=A0A543AYK7_9ACTN|nr:thioredoxin [Stackebrandtia endophytica]TQL77658.1 thioredoxin [Stackebrandtia endophytica]